MWTSVAVQGLMGQPASILRLEAIYYKVKKSSFLFSAKLKLDLILTHFQGVDMFRTTYSLTIHTLMK